MLKVGDKVRVITKNYGIDQFGDEGVIVEKRPNLEFTYRVDFPNKMANTYREGELELIEEPVVAPPVPIPTPFIFVQEIPPGAHAQVQGKPFVIARQYGLEWLNSLEEAQDHCDRLKEIHGQHLDIHAYVRID